MLETANRTSVMGQAAAYRTPESRWQAVAARDGGADGAFFYGVCTTGVYCRPGCASRRPRPENVAFFDTAGEAERAGYRPCRRCQPDAESPRERHARAVVRACRRLETADAPPTLAALAAEAGLSRWHFQRVFKAAVGVTPRQYFAGQRAERFRAGLQSGDRVTDAIYAAGFGSGSSAYASARDELAMTPSDYRAGGTGLELRYGIARCELGWVAVATTGRGICAIEFDDTAEALPERLRAGFPRARLEPAGTELDTLLRDVVALVESPGAAIELPLDIRGTAFRRRVWNALRAVPPGQTVSYAELAARIGRPTAARAVAAACAANRVAVAVPCHRAVRADGGLAGYRWGVARKRALLERERAQRDGGSDGGQSSA
ncbi:MAG: bifunctional DNA-binding transcriptional regulator/O6-methylguanine-DNA methyltransferase Ada [Halofilum sp. (in: g-proteobacteria)]|nr:bifunctional DNA-binding transcriptional regulator/O6-methylguanine-DNA methyltransferase Ada [Halofilum sp. (in: g-proteobacteria)]